MKLEKARVLLSLCLEELVKPWVWMDLTETENQEIITAL